MSINDEIQLSIDQHRLFYQQMRTTTPLQALVVSCWFGVLMYHDSSVFPKLWLAIFMAFLAFRFSVYLKIKGWDDYKVASQMNAVNRNGLIAAALNGLLWSVFYIYSYYHLSERWMFLFAAFVIILMASGFITLAIHKYSFYAFFCCFIIPIIIFTFMHYENGSTLFFMAFMYLFFGFNILSLHKNINKTIIDSLKSVIENKNLANRLKELSNTDSLTTLSNRRHFDEKSYSTLKQVVELRQKFSILMIDIDYFKLYNDNYGHLQGDNVIEQVAKVMKGALIKTSDLIARYGGEEFIVMLANTSEADSERAAKTLVRIVEALEIENKHSKVSPFVTISVGVAVVAPTDDLELKEVIKKADHSLYQAKSEGRNRYCLNS
ncbi:GGDEF domain-containing protein [Marinomonas algicola]|uniref:GGDEF domain-containing protein n=1 Tax=Marinomonas algicola TaxID=2773454 RepID=UPI001749A34B|nr:diguanylate cyclase [Marinomonas algicola]